MRIKYETPEMEIVKFSLKTNVLAASYTDTPEETLKDNVITVNPINPFG